MLTKILLVEDDIRVAQTIQKGLAEQQYNVTVEYNGLSALNNIKNNAFDIVITDIMLPEISGIEMCKAMKQLKPELPVIMLTALGATDDKVEGFDAGADDYLVKPFEMRELLVRIKALLKRYQNAKITQDYILKYADIEMNIHTKSVFRNGIEITLTPKEFNLLQYMLENPERVLSRTEIAEKVWDTHFDTGTNFIDVYINYLRKKIDKEFDKKLIHTKSGMGFILRADN